jgi:hypothetical protein
MMEPDSLAPQGRRLSFEMVAGARSSNGDWICSRDERGIFLQWATHIIRNLLTKIMSVQSSGPETSGNHQLHRVFFFFTVSI